VIGRDARINLIDLYCSTSAVWKLSIPCVPRRVKPLRIPNSRATFTRDGKYALVSIWENVYNKITRSEGTRH